MWDIHQGHCQKWRICKCWELPLNVCSTSIYGYFQVTTDKYQEVKNFTGWLMWPFLTSDGHSHLMWAFSPCMAILTLHEHFHLVLTFSPHMAILTLCGHFHLTWPFVTLHGHLSPHITLLTMCEHFSHCMAISHLMCPFSPHMAIFTLCGHSHLVWTPHLVQSPPWHQKSSCVHPNMREQTFHLTWFLHAALLAKIIFFTSYGKNSPKNHKATPIPSIRYLYEPPKS